MQNQDLKKVIESAWPDRNHLTPKSASPVLKEAVNECLAQMEQGHLRVAKPIDQGQWSVEPWLKQAVLLYFRLQENQVISGTFTQFYDKVPLQFAHTSPEDLKSSGVRIVPPACVRKGAFVGSNTVLMPSYVNIGAYVGEGTLVDTWATIGSCAQIGKNVHISGGVGIGGVLEPLQSQPTIIEDNCFIGARSEVVEGVIVEEGSVLSMGVFLGQSTRIYDRQTDSIMYGRVPAGSVVVPGTLPDKSSRCHLYCAIIVKKVDATTLSKVGINELLRNIENE